jgi:hypothetical protein
MGNQLTKLFICGDVGQTGQVAIAKPILEPTTSFLSLTREHQADFFLLAKLHMVVTGEKSPCICFSGRK